MLDQVGAHKSEVSAHKSEVSAHKIRVKLARTKVIKYRDAKKVMETSL